MWEELTKTRAHDYALWYARADFETYVAWPCISESIADVLRRSRMGDYQRAHEVYTKGCSERSLNYPEYLLEAWLTFETEYGNLADLEFALTKSKRQKKGLERKRARVHSFSPSSFVGGSTDRARFAGSGTSADSSGDGSGYHLGRSARCGLVHRRCCAVAGRRRAEQEARKAGRGGGEREESADTVAGAGGERADQVCRPACSVASFADTCDRRDREHSTVFAIGPTAMGEADVRKLFRDVRPPFSPVRNVS